MHILPSQKLYLSNSHRQSHTPQSTLHGGSGFIVIVTQCGFHAKTMACTNPSSACPPNQISFDKVFFLPYPRELVLHIQLSVNTESLLPANQTLSSSFEPNFATTASSEYFLLRSLSTEQKNMPEDPEPRKYRTTALTESKNVHIEVMFQEDFGLATTVQTYGIRNRIRAKYQIKLFRAIQAIGPIEGCTFQRAQRIQR
ncbi:hypothetical protein BDD12DRAFT_267476 [Trichophaea hybrida]|nr:hypothetical protein BDD12DRAFT_267476 [Trichophaea hybrida]